MKSTYRNCHGFTLIELLVVVLVILALVALLLPALENGRQSAKSTACASNEKQQVIAFRLWAADHNNECLRPPVVNYGSPDGNLYVALSPYIGNTDAIWSDPGADDPPASSNMRHYAISSAAASVWLREENDGALPVGVITGVLTGGGKLPPTTAPAAIGGLWMFPHAVNLDELPYPSSTGVFACKLPCWWPDGGWAGGWVPTMMACYSSWYWPWPLHGVSRLTVNGRVNFSRLDGSVRNYAFQEIVPPSPIGYQGVVPAAFAGLRPSCKTPRYYLWSGWAPNSPNLYGGWLTE